jgi:hypothetical protein
VPTKISAPRHFDLSEKFWRTRFQALKTGLSGFRGTLRTNSVRFLNFEMSQTPHSFRRICPANPTVSQIRA